MQLTGAVATIQLFLNRLENRDIAGVEALVSEDFEMVFPGNARFTDFTALIAWAAPRYKWVKKHHERFDAAETEDGIIVITQGTLFGEDPLGNPFNGVRYADWFLIIDGKIARQHVWNDLAEMRSKQG